MSDIVQRVRGVSALMNEITTASIEQEAGIGDIGSAVHDLDAATQQNAALVDRVGGWRGGAEPEPPLQPVPLEAVPA
jgi:methyl-accepting chemotaxis protein